MTNFQKKYSSFLTILTLGCSLVFGQEWDRIISYRNVYADNALSYVVEQVNVQRVDEGRTPIITMVSRLREFEVYGVRGWGW
jgi:hypothetical protein